MNGGGVQYPHEHAEICGSVGVPGIFRSAAASGRGLARGAVAPLVRLVPVFRSAQGGACRMNVWTTTD